MKKSNIVNNQYSFLFFIREQAFSPYQLLGIFSEYGGCTNYQDKPQRNKITFDIVTMCIWGVKTRDDSIIVCGIIKPNGG